MKTTTLPSQDSITCAPCRRALLFIPLALACFALSPQARAVCQDACLTNANTVQGDDALFSLSGGASNTAIGFEALHFNTTGLSNTATGADALVFNTTGFFNTATGAYALDGNTIGNLNTADGYQALDANTTGNDNTANGANALFFNTTGANNTANGSSALLNNTTASNNTADGYQALLNNTTGNNNTGLGFEAGINLTTGNFNIDIGNAGVAGESKTIRIGTRGAQRNTFIAGISGVTVANGVGVIIDNNGHLGTVVSSERFKDEIKPMDKASEAILALKPVTFRYKKELDPDGIPQFGLVAEDVEKVNPDLVARDEQGKPYSVRYEAVNAMLLNEFLKEHRTVEEQARTNEQQERTISELRTALAQQQKKIEALTAGLQKVSAQVEMTRRAPQTVVDNH